MPWKKTLTATAAVAALTSTACSQRAPEPVQVSDNVLLAEWTGPYGGVPAFDAMGTRLTGAFLMILGAITWGVATIIVKAVNWKMGMLALSGWQFLIGSIPLILCAIIFGDPATLLEMDRTTGAALAYSALIPMIFCQAVWFTVVRRLPTTLASMGTLLVPPLGVYSAAVMLDEMVGFFEFAALALVVLALLLILPGFNWRASLHPPPASRPE